MYYLIVVVLLFVAELFYFRLADRFDIIDRPNERSSHKRITLRGGGIIFYFGALAYFIVSGGAYPWFMLGVLAYVNAEIRPFVEPEMIDTMICAVVVFCFFNFRKRAKCFAGDVGAVSIAFVLLFLLGMNCTCRTWWYR